MSSLKRKTCELDNSDYPPGKRKTLETKNKEAPEDILKASLDELKSQTNACNDDGDDSILGGEDLKGKIA